MSAVAVFIGALIILGPGVLILQVIFAMVAAFLIAGAGNAINDYCDVEADKINRPNRPIPSGRMKKNNALILALLLFIIGVFLGWMVNLVAFGIALVNSLVLIAYSYSLQNKFLLGNISVSYLVGSTFLFGGAAAGNLVLPMLLFLLAFFSNLAREIVKDLEDIEGDRKSLLKNLASKTKEKMAVIGERFNISSMGPKLKHKKLLHSLAMVSLVLAILVSPLPWLMNVLGVVYLIVLIPADFFLLLSLFQIASDDREGRFRSILRGKKKYGRASKYIKMGMLFGLLAFILGALF